MVSDQNLNNVAMGVEPGQTGHVNLLEVVVIEQFYYKLKGEHLIRVIEKSARYIVHALGVAGT